MLLLLIATVLTKFSVYKAKPGHAFAENGRPNYTGNVNNIYQVSTLLSQDIIVQIWTDTCAWHTYIDNQ